MHQTAGKKLARRVFALGVLSGCLLLLTLFPPPAAAEACWECDVSYQNCRYDCDQERAVCPFDPQTCDVMLAMCRDNCWNSYGNCLGNCTIEPRPTPTPGPTPGTGGGDSDCRARCGTQHRVCRQNADADVCTPQYQECLSLCPA